MKKIVSFSVYLTYAFAFGAVNDEKLIDVFVNGICVDKNLIFFKLKLFINPIETFLPN